MHDYVIPYLILSKTVKVIRYVTNAMGLENIYETKKSIVF